MDESQADGKRGPERSSPLFDPVAGMRAMADIQAEGLHAASELLERILRSEPDGARARSRSRGGEYTALVDAWIELLRRTIGGLAPPGEPGSVTVAVDSNGVGPTVRLALRGSSGGTGAVAEVWLQNATFSAVGPLTLHCGQLSAPDGTVLDAAEVCFEPREVALVAPRSSRAVHVWLAASGSLRRGTYRGTIQAHGLPELWLPFEVAIE
jgi:hypothetical protein